MSSTYLNKDHLVQSLQLTVSQDSSHLQSAQKELENAAKLNFGDYLRILSEILVESTNSRVVRMAAALQLKNSLTNKTNHSKEINEEPWSTLPDHIKTIIKENVISALGTEPTAAQCVARIASAELPLNQWPELIPLFTSKANTTNQNDKEREAVIEAIGFICLDVNINVLRQFSTEILQAIIHCMRQTESNQRVRLAAINALINSLDFIQHHFEAENERNLIMQVICDASQSTDIDVRVAALQALVKIASLHYQHLEHYMDEAILWITVDAIECDDANVSLQGIEFWLTVSEIEVDSELQSSSTSEDNGQHSNLDESKRYIQRSLPHLIPILIKCISNQEETDEEDDWIPSKAAALCLMMLSHATEEIGKYVLPLAKNLLKNSDWRTRKAAAMAVGCIVEGLAGSSKIEIESFLPRIWDLTADKVASVRDSAVWAIGRIIEFFPQYIPAKLDPLIDGLIRGLTDDPRVAQSSCWTLSELVKASYRSAVEEANGRRPETLALSEFYPVICQKLVETATRPEVNRTTHLRTAAFEVLKIVLVRTPSDCYAVLHKTVYDLINLFEMSLKEDEPDEEFQSLSCILLTSTLAHLQSDDKSIVCNLLMTSFVKILASCSDFSQARCVHEEVLLAISSVARASGKPFDDHVKDLLPALVQGLKCDYDNTVCQLCLGLTGDIFRALESSGSQYFDALIVPLISILSQNADLKTKVELVGVFGDMASAVGSLMKPHLEPVCNWMRETKLNFTMQVEREQTDTMMQWVENCLQFFINTVESLKRDSESSDVLNAHFGQVTDLLDSIAPVGDRIPEGITAAASILIRHIVIDFSEHVSARDLDVISAFVGRSNRAISSHVRSLCQSAKEAVDQLKKKMDEVDR